LSSAILLTGTSGMGKSSVINAFAGRGYYDVVDVDSPRMRTAGRQIRT
jgi:dephospho-CoA kinase